MTIDSMRLQTNTTITGPMSWQFLKLLCGLYVSMKPGYRSKCAITIHKRALCFWSLILDCPFFYLVRHLGAVQHVSRPFIVPDKRWVSGQ